ncbi:MAG: hypothetical protein ACLFPE_07115 [Bacteroidales bacterium]
MMNAEPQILLKKDFPVVNAYKRLQTFLCFMRIRPTLKQGHLLAPTQKAIASQAKEPIFSQRLNR